MITRSMGIPYSRLLRHLGAVGATVLVGCGPKQAGAPPAVGTDAVDVGYGAVEGDEITGSVSTVDMETRGGGVPRTFAQLLQGQPGVMVVERQGHMTVRIRGGSGSFMADQEPLCVLDGVILSSSQELMALPPSIVRSVTVLKDAASTAAYGSRGANGVIVVRTKKGGG
ncbi:MAG TPA: TonB-dependent receptor plug domain-containing protein [Longimicrobiales bacterium]|nr:TonB-dependent receptor plug domain-containing protein [Longimicrobiales bacterium]